MALSTGLGWVVIVLFHSTVYLLERRGIGYHLSSEDGPLPNRHKKNRRTKLGSPIFYSVY